MLMRSQNLVMTVVIVVSFLSSLASAKNSASRPIWLTDMHYQATGLTVEIASAKVVNGQLGAAREKAILIAVNGLFAQYNKKIFDEHKQYLRRICQTDAGNQTCSNIESDKMKSSGKTDFNQISWRLINFWFDSCNNEVNVRVVIDESL